MENEGFLFWLKNLRKIVPAITFNTTIFRL